ncbi:MAG: UbiD family decarboxylase [Chloroflexota bacterium]
MSYYKDIREFLETLDKRGKLVRIKSPINKDTELMPLVKLQYVGLPEAQRKAFLFENVFDSRGKKYNGSVAVAALAGSPEIYAIGMNCKPEEMTEKRAQAELHPIEPKLVSKGPVQEEVHMGKNLMEHGALDELAVPISAPGFDAGPCFTAPFWITKDPETGVRNIGTYRVMPKSPTKTGIDWANMTKGCAIHWLKAKKMGKPLPAAIVTGGPPCIGYVSVTRYLTDVDELKVAGGIAGEPIEVVKCKTVDLEVPAWAEIVVEGEINTQEVEPEGPFGESIGFMCLEQLRAFFNVTAITHRKNPVWVAFISQYQPSESSVLKKYASSTAVYKHLRYDLGLDYVKDVAFQETSDTSMMVIQVARTSQENVWKALEGAAKRHQFSKIIIAVDDFVDPANLDSVFWAVTHCSQPHRDYRIITRPTPILLDCSVAPMEELESLRDELYTTGKLKNTPDSSVILMNGTIKWPYPPISLPRQEYMEKALERWKKEGLPDLKLGNPWYGIELGYWSERDKQRADWAVKGEYYKTGEEQATRQRRA